MSFPDFIIGGGARSGTTSLASWLNDQNFISLPDHELNYFAFATQPFDYEVSHRSPDTDLSAYLTDLHQNTTAQTKIVGEKSVSYLYKDYYSRVISNIREIHPAWETLKFIFILRHPADRAYSQYLYNRNFHETLDFGQAINHWPQRKKLNWVPAYDYYGAGLYANALQAYLKTFAHVRIYLFDNLTDETESTLKDILNFLGTGEFEEISVFPWKNASSSRPASSLTNTILKSKYFNTYIRNPLTVLGFYNQLKDMFINSTNARPNPNPSLMQSLTSKYHPEIKRLEKIIETDLSAWITKWEI